jgi:nucleoside-diphosphate-sugar epimerase
MILALEMGRSGEVYNLGTDGHTRITISALAEAIRGIMGSTARINFQEGAGDISRSTDTAKARLACVGLLNIVIVRTFDKNGV